jgi:hypothetical protein
MMILGSAMRMRLMLPPPLWGRPANEVSREGGSLLEPHSLTLPHKGGGIMWNERP